MIGTTLNQRFSLDKELGRGGMGAVYRATDQILQRAVAVKVLKDLSGEEVGRKLRLEAQITARLVHDNIVRLYDFGLDSETYYFVMEEVDGTGFQKRWRKLELTERLRILAQVADALDYAHHQGVIHRDVKPANILLTSADQPKLSDFGLSMLVDSEVDETGTVRGTPHYMSPEQARGHRVDYRTDLYALGVILYECCTGSTPFQGPAMGIMSQHVNSEPEPPRTRQPDLSPDLETLILAMMAKNPDQRPGSGREIAERLRELMGRGQVGAKPVEPARPSSNVAVPANATMESAPAALSGDESPPTRMTSEAARPAQPSSVSVVESPRKANRRARRQPGSVAVRDVIEVVTSQPVMLDADERYYCGHYLAYLLGGSRRKGFLLRRPLDPLNADRARLVLAMTYLMQAGLEDRTLERAAMILDTRPDVRPALSPVVMVKYLASRESPKKRKRFRHVRSQLAEASEYARAHMIDARGILNPGLMPQVLDDLKKLAPPRTEVDDLLVQRWNRVTEVWRGNSEFRDSVLRYATRRAVRDPASVELWPEVVYPLIERAQWQRHIRSGAEAFWDAMAASLRLPDPGVQMDRVFREAIPKQVAQDLDIAPDAFVEEPDLEAEPSPDDAEAEAVQRLTMAVGGKVEGVNDLDARSSNGNLIRLVNADPIRANLGELRTIWRDAIAVLRTPAAAKGTGGRTLPVGPYRLIVVASIRSRAAGTIVLQGMPNKQLEMHIPSFSGGGSDSRTIVAIWLYQNQSVALTFYDNLGQQGYIIWDAATRIEHKLDSPEEFNRELYQLNMELPDQLDRVLTKRFKPQSTA